VNKSKKIKIIVTDYIEEDLNWEQEQLRSFPSVTLDAYQLKHASEDQLVEQVCDAHIIVVNMAQFNECVVNALDNCQLIIRHGVGYDNVDVQALTRKGIILINIPDYCVEEVAEQTVMLIFNCARKFIQQQESMTRSVEKGQWDFDLVYPIYQISDKTLGIIGCGRIGSTVFRMMKSFNMKYMICDPYLTEARKRELGIITVPLNKVLIESDMITIHTPLNDETRHLISEAQLKMMKGTAFIINTARGGILDEDAIVKACQQGWIAGAALDVYEFREPPNKNSKLLAIDNITLTPHLAWYSVESEWKIRKKIIENIILFIEGKQLKNIINPVVLENDPCK
jgi:D-3-phosphoglycerate dehydrogenase